MPFAWGWSHAFSLVLFVIHLLVVARAITRPDRTPASRVAWVAIIMFLPAIGVIIYVLLGETSIGSDRVRRLREAERTLARPSAADPAPALHPPLSELSELCTAINGLAPTEGNRIDLLGDPTATPKQPMVDSDVAINALIAERGIARGPALSIM